MNTIGAIDEEIQHLTFRPANDMGICRKYGGALPQFAGHNNRTTDFPGDEVMASALYRMHISSCPPTCISSSCSPAECGATHDLYAEGRHGYFACRIRCVPHPACRTFLYLFGHDIAGRPDPLHRRAMSHAIGRHGQHHGSSAGGRLVEITESRHPKTALREHQDNLSQP